ncbi:MAG: tetratricopeptide repeat protein [Spirulinaceae cyanobacterium]
MLGTTLNTLGVVCQRLGKYENALTYYQQALAISKELGNRSGEGTTLSNLGLVYQSTGKYEEALTYYQHTDKLVDEAFNKDTFEDNMDTYTVVHFATHAALVPGKPEESFILFGSGETVSLKEVDEKWSINNVDLVVLSAYQTGLDGL